MASTERAVIDNTLYLMPETLHNTIAAITFCKFGARLKQTPDGSFDLVTVLTDQRKGLLK